MDGARSLKMGPVPELASLRKTGAADRYAGSGREPASRCLPVRGRQLEVSFSVLVESADDASSLPAAASVSVLASPDGPEQTRAVVCSDIQCCHSTHTSV